MDEQELRGFKYLQAAGASRSGEAAMFEGQEPHTSIARATQQTQENDGTRSPSPVFSPTRVSKSSTPSFVWQWEVTIGEAALAL
jgi:hypothetical protein